MKLNRRNFITSILAGFVAALATRKWPEWARHAAGQERHVCKRRGSDDNDGLTPDTAKATLSAAMRQCKGSGEIVYVMDRGYFTELEPIDSSKDNVSLVTEEWHAMNTATGERMRS